MIPNPGLTALQLAISIALCYTLSFQIMHALARVSGRYSLLRLLLFPGVVVHESAHAAACILTGTPIQNISFWSETGGHVVHHQPKLAILTQPLISFAPFPVGIASLLLLSRYLTEVHWLLAILLLFLMVSIAATLAPSKTDVVHAIEGSLVLIAIVLATYLIYPRFITSLQPALEQFNRQMLIVLLVLGVIWATLLLFHRTVRHLKHR